MYKVINVKEYYTNRDYAMYLLDTAIKDAKMDGTQVLVVVHGYGSHGKGGVIKSCIRTMLKTYKKQNKIATYIGGEEWGDTNPDKQHIQSICPQTVLSKDIGGLNPGITIVLVYE